MWLRNERREKDFNILGYIFDDFSRAIKADPDETDAKWKFWVVSLTSHCHFSADELQ
jgi:hypothetical protein